MDFVTVEASAGPFWLRFLPASLRSRVERRPELLKILSNIGWLFGDKVLRMGVGLLVGVWVARYLGPEGFGRLSYAAAFVGLFGAVATLGLQGIVVRDIVRDPDGADATLGTAFVLRLSGGLLAVALVLCAVTLARPDDDLARIMVAILGLALVLQSSEVVKYWFESQVRSRYTVWVENGAFLVMAAVKIVMILHKAPLLAFAWAVLAESVLVAAGLFAVYARLEGRLKAWKPRLDRAKSLLRDSWPLILSGLAVMVYMRIDQVMLGQMIGPEAVGLYSAAVRISEAWYFIPMAVVASVFPAIIEAKKKSEKLYYDRLQKLYDFMVLVSVSVALSVTFTATWIIQSLFGRAYEDASTVLSIHIWASPFVFLGVASGKWFLVENRQLLAFFRVFWGMVVNVLFNGILIVQYGAIGAAYATLLSQITAALLFDVFQKETRKMFKMKLKAFFILRMIYV